MPLKSACPSSNASVMPARLNSGASSILELELEARQRQLDLLARRGAERREQLGQFVSPSSAPTAADAVDRVRQHDHHAERLDLVGQPQRAVALAARTSA